MADLLDIVPETAVESVHVAGGQHLIVHGLRGPAIAQIVSRFPHLASLLGGIDLGPKLIAQFGNAIGPIIAAGLGHLNDEKYEQAAAELLVEDQLKLVKAILGLTFPNGMVSFVKTMTAFLIGTDEGEKPVIRMRLKQSPSTSPPLSAEDSPPTMQ